MQAYNFAFRANSFTERFHASKETIMIMSYSVIIKLCKLNEWIISLDSILQWHRNDSTLNDILYLLLTPTHIYHGHVW